MGERFAVGSSIGGFVLGERLGAGSGGEVWSARELSTGERVALKRARPGAGDRLLQEAAVLRSVQTPYVVRLRAVLDVDEPVLVLDHLPGGSLARLLARRRVLSPGEAVTIGVAVARGLAAAHERGLVHGDLSPANVLFTAAGMPVLIDLGAGAVGELRGTAGYVDPALLFGTDPGPAADVWALGALVVHVLTGDPPYGCATASVGLAAAQAQERAPLGLLAPELPRALVALVEQAVDPDPTQRPSAASFATAMQRAQEATPVRFGPDPSVRSAPGMGRNGQEHSPATEDQVPGPEDHVRRPNNHGQGDASQTGLRETEVIARYLPTHAEPEGSRRRPPLSVIVSALVVLGLLGGGLTWAVRGAGDADAYSALPPLSADPTTRAPAVTPTPAEPVPSADSTSAGSVAPGLTGSPDPSETAGAASPSQAAPPRVLPTDWPTVVDALDQTRESAFSLGSTTLLAEVYADGSTTGASDTAALQTLVQLGQTVDGVRHQLQDVTPVQVAPTTVTLQVTDTLNEQVVLDDQGNAVDRRPGRGVQTYKLSLVAGPDGWRIKQID